ncbi:MAG TPA: response regulator [Polyangiaceae bacterium]
MSEGSQPRILVVDDTAENRELVRATLESEGMEVLIARGGEEGVALFASEQPDCVLLDVRMPDLDGFAACERIRALPGGPQTPVVFLTALRDVDVFDRALSVGADDFLVKPVRPTELIIRVQAALKLRRIGAARDELYEMVKKQRDDLMRLKLQNERLMAFLVHDFKNPVNSLDLRAQLLLRDKRLHPEALDSVKEMRQDARHLLRMILNVLDLSKSEDAQLLARRTTVDLPVLVEQVVEELSMHAQAFEVKVKPRLELSVVQVDLDLMERTLANLLENSIRHAPRGSEVEIHAQQVGDRIELRIRDSGHGVPEELRSRIFERFVQNDASGMPSSRSGRGLGLAFCKLAVEAHAGEIWVEDARPGAVFCLRISNG